MKTRVALIPFVVLVAALCAGPVLLAPRAAHAQSVPADVAGNAAFDAVRQFYAERNYRTIWTDGDRFTARGRALPAILDGAARHGLDPEIYGVTRMRAVLSDDQPDGPNAWRQAELFWTYGAWQYASDLIGHPADAATLESVVTGDIADNVAELAPDLPLYKALQEKLARIDARMAALEPAAGFAGNKPDAGPAADEVDAAAKAESKSAKPAGPAHAQKPVVETFNFGRPLFRPGMSHKQVPELRARMISFGAYETLPPEAEEKAHIYDAQLARAVGRFQHEYGLKDDGAIGPVTLGILNRTPDAERQQVVANLQRLREPHRRLREDKRIEVSIARYWMTAYDNGHEAFSMPVIVGQPRRQTISFRTEISGVRLNPTWTVPNTIRKEDFLPLLVKDPAKLSRKYGVKVMHGGKALDPTSQDWAALPPRELAQVGFWRPAGDGNPLGRYRVIMENPYDIYLHDTNQPDLFKASMRAQSSGCVRVARPDELVAFLLAGKKGWSAGKTAEILKKGRTTDVVIENKVPIYLDYMTAWFNDRRQLILGVDVYGLDKPRYDVLVKNGLTTQRNAQRILTRVSDILAPELKEAQNRESVSIPSTN